MGLILYLERVEALGKQIRRYKNMLARLRPKKPKAPKVDGRTTAERLKKDRLEDARHEMVRGLPAHEFMARIVARGRGIDPDVAANAEVMKTIIVETKARLEKMPAKPILKSLPGDDD